VVIRAEGQRRRAALVELALSLALLALGAFVLAVAGRMPATGGFSGVGPGAMPTLVGVGLVGVGLWLLGERLTGGWRQAEPEPTARGEHAFHGAGFCAQVLADAYGHRLCPSRAIWLARASAQIPRP